jgi:bifunctional non-homologous end joining protein LigD
VRSEWSATLYGLLSADATRRRKAARPKARKRAKPEGGSSNVRRSGRKAGLIEPCLPSPAQAPPTGSDWLHEIKHDGFRIMALRDAKGVRLYTRNGYNFADRFSLVVAAVAALPVRSCLIDGEAIVSDESGLAVFELIRSWPTNLSAVLCAFDLLEADGEDLRRLPIEIRKAGLVQLLRGPQPGIALSTHYVGDGEIV